MSEEAEPTCGWCGGEAYSGDTLAGHEADGCSCRSYCILHLPGVSE